MGERKGIELLRYTVRLLDRCRESFNQKFSAEELLRIAEACQRSKWDIWPDEWTERQVRECVQLGLVPEWEDKNGDVVPKYRNETDNVFKVAVTWTMTGEVTINADSLPEAVAYAEGDMPVPKVGEYLDDSFQVDEDSTSEINGGEDCHL